MAYITDKQTDTDLNLSGRFKSNSIFNLFDSTVTRGGGLLLEKAFGTPLTSAAEISSRRDIFIAMQTFKKEFPISNEHFGDVDEYLSSADYNHIILSAFAMLRKKIMGIVASSSEYQMIAEGITTTQHFLNGVECFFQELKHTVAGTAFENRIDEGLQVLSEHPLSKFRQKNIAQINLWDVTRNNHLLRKTYGKRLRGLLRLLEEADFYLSVSREGKAKGFCYPEVLDSEKTHIEMTNVRHPRVQGAVGNNIKLTHDSNVIFLTGANMAGKSTLMKSFGISLYLAQLGFPIPADKMTFTPMEGMFTSINVPDDLTQGYSHFYAEVMRVKGIAKEVASGKRLIVIFDELFKGTNVKDAYDGTVAITEAFSKCGKCSFIISTHIMEAGKTLENEYKNIQFVYLPTLLKDDRPTYTYKLNQGIADDRHGMRIINNERIIEIIKEAS